MVKVQEPPVCTEPKVFLGSIPPDATSDDVSRVFGRYGTLKSVTILTTPDGRSRGCAMLLFDSWTAAEAAIEAENGTTSLGGGLGKGMVVKFADPPKRGGQDGGPVVGLVPRKLFVGQVPGGTTHDVLRSVFAPYGNIQDLHIVQKQMGAGCALLTFQKWASAEAAIEAHNGKTVMPGGTGPLVVRFADAKYADGGNAYGGGGMGMGGMAGGGQKRQFGDMGMMPNKRQFGGGGMGGGFGNPYGFGMMPGMMGMMGMPGGMQGFMPPGMQNNMGAYNMMQNAAAMSAMRMGAGGSDNAGGGGGMGQGAGGGMGGGAGGMMGGMGGAFGGGRAFGSGFGSGGMKGGANEVAKQWKLFIGQIPYEADESDLWPLLSSYGNILELTILRNAGKSKGCGFCTYESYASAATAAQQLNNVAGIDNDPRGRKLIVKFANPSAAMAAGSQQQLQGGQATSLAGQQQQQQQQQAMLQGGGVVSPGAGMGGGLDSAMMMMGGGGGGGQGQGYLNPAQQMGGYQQQMGGGMMMM